MNFKEKRRILLVSLSILLIGMSFVFYSDLSQNIVGPAKYCGTDVCIDMKSYQVGQTINFTASHLNVGHVYLAGVVIGSSQLGYTYLFQDNTAYTVPANGSIAGSFYLGSITKGATIFAIADATSCPAFQSSNPGPCPPPPGLLPPYVVGLPITVSAGLLSIFAPSSHYSESSTY